MITKDEVKARSETFWDAVKSGMPGAEMEHFFIGEGHVMVPDGKRMDLETHQQMHRALCDESHHWQSLQVIQVGDHPERAYAAGQVNWEASFADGRPGRVKAAVEEQWLLERGSDGVLRWVHYRSRVVDFTPDSAPLEI